MSRYLAPIFFWALIAIATMLITVSGATEKKTPDEILAPFQTEETLPGGTVTTADTQSKEIAELVRPNTLVIFWNVYCDECQQTLADTQKLAESQPKLNVVLINQRNTTKEALDKLGEESITLPNYFDQTGECFDAWRSTMPGVFFVDENREIVLRFPGRPDQEHYESIEKVYFETER